MLTNISVQGLSIHSACFPNSTLMGEVKTRDAKKPPKTQLISKSQVSQNSLEICINILLRVHEVFSDFVSRLSLNVHKHSNVVIPKPLVVSKEIHFAFVTACVERALVRGGVSLKVTFNSSLCKNAAFTAA